MKKTILILLTMLLFGQLSIADVVTEREARKKAAEFFSSMEAATKSSPVRAEDFTLVYSLKGTDTKSSSQSPSVYVFDRSGGGYVVVSGDDAAVPVLGWSSGGSFPKDNIPENMKAMLEWYDEIISYASSRGWKSASYSSPKAAGEKVLLSTAQWGQWSPSNDLLPEIDGKKPPVGCVPLAIGIIMRYHRWPEKGTGTLPAYESWDKDNGNYNHVDAVTLGHKYDWDKMPAVAHVYKTVTDEEKAQIARLMYDVAVMCETNFSQSGSGGLSTNVKLLPEYFGYDKSIKYLQRSTYPVNALGWEQIVKDEIDAGRPVLYSGIKTIGHAYVIDGYYDRYFSVNWGWHGTGYDSFPGYDVPIEDREDTGGYRYYYNLTPIEGHESDLVTYYKNQEMHTQIMPDSGEPERFSFFTGMDCISLLPSEFKIGERFWFYTSFRKDSAIEVPVQFRFDHFDRNGIFKETVSPVNEYNIRSGFSVPVFGCVISVKPEDGDRIVMMRFDDASGQWVEIEGPRRSKFIFTSRPLSELVEVGYEEQNGGAYPDNPKDFYVKAYKDLSWSIKNDSTGEILFPPVDGMKSIVGQENELSLIDVADRDDPDCDKFLIRCAVPSGSYTVSFYNPVTEEEMDIHLEF
ncbi:MAG: C10 family peptidase [Bacteroidales bacterium]|nr:C10 family peptidase [Bacteroidales bacterium]